MSIKKVMGRETIASLATAIGFTAAQIPPTAGKEGVIYALCQPLGGDIRICEDGSTPSTSLGIRVCEDVPFEVWGDKALRNFRAINDGGTATLEVIYNGAD